ncbi:hypothetical protein VC83_03942 [Pseudogymnoascus destructans]|uniref:Uncharacterized protein n=2 Tax=Pseudogymnoascus destructans TaxID=655981 RepID=L8FQA3_PSED2|nr:uncharacterized protein VC83_03942 [Pseudogymnoascus destructans]ELR01896.1 hypothetical protein GMDG_05078 [Pseudogymnoascus destructans 20631-21]OAF59655.1 hypothetical protein VC83_03942 [Pseudogymnoascus destructans]
MKPSKEEREQFYLGMDNSEADPPELIARSSTFLFQPYTKASQDEPEEWMMKRNSRSISTIGNHKIVEIYDSKLRAKVLDILSDIPWKTIDIVRVGCKDDNDHPPVVLITAAASGVDDDDAQDAVQKIHELMLEHDLPDVHGEMKTGQVFELERYNSGDRYPLELVRVLKMGYSISNADLTFAGSICLFLKIDGVHYALTCQHVVTSSAEAFTPGKGKDLILQPSKGDLQDEATTLNGLMAKPQAFLEKFEADKLKFKRDEAPPPEATQDQADMFQKQLDGYRKRKTAMESAMAEVSLPFGTLMHAPGIAPHPTTNFRRDWALIKLNEDRFQSLPPNVLPPTHFSDKERVIITEIYNEAFDLEFKNPVTTIRPLKEVKGVLGGSGPPDLKDQESLRVVKHGRTSGWTSGSLNEIRSDCSLEGLTTEYCVVNVPDLNRFSYGGDSGSCVLDLNGRIVGMLHSGNGTNVRFGAEITYVAPIEWLLQDIKETLGTENIVIEKGDKKV